MLLFSPGAPKNEMDPGVLARSDKRRAIFVASFVLSFVDKESVQYQQVSPGASRPSQGTQQRRGSLRF
jgi:hypothetical protein